MNKGKIKLGILLMLPMFITIAIVIHIYVIQWINILWAIIVFIYEPLLLILLVISFGFGFCFLLEGIVEE